MRTACLIRRSSKNNRVLTLQLETNNSRLMMLELGALTRTTAMHGIQTTTLTTVGIMVWIQAAMRIMGLNPSMQHTA